MASNEIPPALAPLLTSDVYVQLATVRPDGRPSMAIVWADYDGRHILINSPVGSRKGRNVRANPAVALIAVDPTNAFRYVQVSGRVVDIRPDLGLELIDRLSFRYKGTAFSPRDKDRETFVIEPDYVRAKGA